MTQVVFDFSPTVFLALRKAPAEFAAEMRIAAACHWYSQGMVSQGIAAEIAGMSRAEFLDELFHRKISATQLTLEELHKELQRDEGQSLSRANLERVQLVSDAIETDFEERLTHTVSLLTSYEGVNIESDIEEIARSEVEIEDPLQARLIQKLAPDQ